MAKCIRHWRFYRYYLSLFSHHLWKSKITFMFLMHKVSNREMEIFDKYHASSKRQSWDYIPSPTHCRSSVPNMCVDCVICMCVSYIWMLCRDVCVCMCVWQWSSAQGSLCMHRKASTVGCKQDAPAIWVTIPNWCTYFSISPFFTMKSLIRAWLSLAPWPIQVLLSNSKNNNQM